MARPDLYCRNPMCPGYGTPKAEHQHSEAETVQRRSDGGKVSIPKDEKQREGGPNPKRDESTSPDVKRYG